MSFSFCFAERKPAWVFQKVKLLKKSTFFSLNIAFGGKLLLL